jgi:hypothetical protein
MGSRKFVFCVALCALAAFGAARADDDITGTLTVRSSLQVVDKKGKEVALNPGVIPLNLDLDGSPGKQELKLNFKDSAGKKRKAVLRVPGEKTLPKEGGEVVLYAVETGQPFNLAVQAELAHVDGPTIEAVEPCNCVPVDEICTEYGCYQVGGGCYQQDVRYHERETTVTQRAAFRNPKTGDDLANWDGERSYSTRIYEYVGACSGGY